MIRRFIPNLITLGNLLCGCIGIVVILVTDNTFRLAAHSASWLLIFAAVLDFMDGAAARLLKVQSEIGKQLDSLADVVTFGVLPGLMTFRWLQEISTLPNLPYLAFIIPLFSAYRLAKFNIDTRQQDAFLGLPTPANALFFASFWLIAHYQPHSFITSALHQQWVIASLCVLFSFLLTSELSLFSLKFKSLKWKENSYRLLFIGMALVLFISFYFTAIPFIILLYLLISVVKNVLER